MGDSWSVEIPEVARRLIRTLLCTVYAEDLGINLGMNRCMIDGLRRSFLRFEGEDEVTKNEPERLIVTFDRSESAALRLLARTEELSPDDFVRKMVRCAIGFAESLGRAELLKSKLEPEAK